MNSVHKKMTELHNKIISLAEKEETRLVNEIMQKHPELVRYIHAMGDAIFVDNEGETISVEDFEAAKALYDFLNWGEIDLWNELSVEVEKE